MYTISCIIIICIRHVKREFYSSLVVRMRAIIVLVTILAVVVVPLGAVVVPPPVTFLDPALHIFVPLVLGGEEIVESGKGVKVRSLHGAMLGLSWRCNPDPRSRRR